MYNLFCYINLFKCVLCCLLKKEIKVYEKYKQTSEYNEKKYVGALLLYSIVLYIIGAVFYFIYLMPKNMGDRVKTLIPFFIMPLM